MQIAKWHLRFSSPLGMLLEADLSQSQIEGVEPKTQIIVPFEMDVGIL